MVSIGRGVSAVVQERTEVRDTPAYYLTVLLFLNGLDVIDQGQDPSDHVSFIKALATFWLAKHLAPNRHVTGPMPLHLLTAVDDPIHLPERELALVLFA